MDHIKSSSVNAGLVLSSSLAYAVGSSFDIQNYFNLAISYTLSHNIGFVINAF